MTYGAKLHKIQFNSTEDLDDISDEDMADFDDFYSIQELLFRLRENWNIYKSCEKQDYFRKAEYFRNQLAVHEHSINQLLAENSIVRGCHNMTIFYLYKTVYLWTAYAINDL